jgi:small-conductance mechanosensitive channel
MTHDQIHSLLQIQLYRSNTVRDLLVSLLIFAGSMAVLWVFKTLIFRRLKKLVSKTPTTLDDFLLEIFNKTILPLLYLGSAYIALNHLDISRSTDRAIGSVFKVATIIQVVRAFLSVLTYLIRNSWIKLETHGSIASKSIVTLARIVVWLVAILFIIDNLGYDINSVIAGLGVGGVAVALAAQTILGDVFNYFVIIFDKPFKEGDFIVMDEFKGEIERIGIKSTRIRSLQGELLIVSNSNLTASRVRNYKHMEKRRALLTLGVVYQTPPAKLRQAVLTVRSIIEGTPGVILDRAHFKTFGDFSLIIEAVYFVKDYEYNAFMGVQERVNLAIMEAFEREGIEFAYPTQTLFVNGTARGAVDLIKN